MAIKSYNITVGTIHKYAQSVFISRPKMGGWYQEMALRYGLCQQPAVLFDGDKL
jgi:hypothetical protein